MKIILFLGSGVSFPSGLPGVEQLTGMILGGGTYYKDLYDRKRGKHPRADVHETHVEPHVQLLRLLCEQDKKGRSRTGYYIKEGRFAASGDIYRGNVTYEDLFYLTREMDRSTRGLADNALVAPFVEAVARLVHRRARGIVDGKSQKARIIDLGSLARTALESIETTVAEALHTECIKGLDLISDLVKAPWVQELNIVTLNHDVLVEQYLTSKGIVFVDGFGKREGDVRWYDDSVYDDANVKARIFKLHGSVDWYSFRQRGMSRRGAFCGVNVQEALDGDGAPLKLAQQRPSFLSGMDKAVFYNGGIYADVHYRFHQVLRDCPLMVMSGYGWGDMAINVRIDTWLDASPMNRIILLHQDKPEEAIQRSLFMDARSPQLLKSRRLVIRRKWLCGMLLDELEACCHRSREIPYLAIVRNSLPAAERRSGMEEVERTGLLCSGIAQTPEAL